MNRIAFITAAAVLSLSVAPAFAATATATPTATCSTSDVSKFQPQAKLTDMLTKSGLTVRQIKVEKGCYEVYAVDKDGKKVNTAYNAETLEQVGNAEAGEN